MLLRATRMKYPSFNSCKTNERSKYTFEKPEIEESSLVRLTNICPIEANRNFCSTNVSNFQT